jgi:hypothetical protein
MHPRHVRNWDRGTRRLREIRYRGDGRSCGSAPCDVVAHFNADNYPSRNRDGGNAQIKLGHYCGDVPGRVVE